MNISWNHIWRRAAATSFGVLCLLWGTSNMLAQSTDKDEKAPPAATAPNDTQPKEDKKDKDDVPDTKPPKAETDEPKNTDPDRPDVKKPDNDPQQPRPADDNRDNPKENPRDDRDAPDARDPRDNRDVPRDTDRRDVERRDTDRRDTERRDVDVERRDTDRRDVDVNRRDVDRRDTNVRTNTNTRNSFNINTYRSADMGLWFRSSQNGLVISDIGDSGPIARVGFRAGDQIVSVNGQRIARERDFIRYLYADDVRNGRVKVIVLRGGQQQVVWVEPTVFIQDTQYAHSDPIRDFGIVIDDRDANRLVVWKVYTRTPAYYSGVRSGDTIVAFDGREVRTEKELATLMEKNRSASATMEIVRNKEPRTIDVEFTSVSDQTYDRHEVRRVNPDDTAPAIQVAPAPRTVTQPPVRTAPPRTILPRIRGRY